MSGCLRNRRPDKPEYAPLLQNLIWITFVPAWALILAAVAEENLKVQSTALGS